MKNNQMMVMVVVVILAALGFFMLRQMQMERESMVEEEVEETMAPEATPLDPNMMNDEEAQDAVIDGQVEEIEVQLDAMDEEDLNGDDLEKAGAGL